MDHRFSFHDIVALKPRQNSLLFKNIKIFMRCFLEFHWRASQRAPRFHGTVEVVMQFYAVIISQKPSQGSLGFMEVFVEDFLVDFYFSVRGNESSRNQVSNPSLLRLTLRHKMHKQLGFRLTSAIAFKCAFLTAQPAFNYLCLIIFRGAQSKSVESR